MKTRDDFNTYGVWHFGNFVECGSKQDSKRYQDLHGGILITRNMIFECSVITWDDNIK